eukprot:692330-Prorocentrum_minimum.AAC.2
MHKQASQKLNGIGLLPGCNPFPPGGIDELIPGAPLPSRLAYCRPFDCHQYHVGLLLLHLSRHPTGISSRRTNWARAARVYSHDGPIGREPRGYILGGVVWSGEDAQRTQHRLQTVRQGVHRMIKGDALGPQP